MAITLTDVTLRDGLQLVQRIIPYHEKLELYHVIKDCPVSRIEITSFVHPKWVPQFQDADILCESLFAGLSTQPSKPQTMAFTPNVKGLDRLLKFPLDWVSTFIATTETFNQKNINASIDETFKTLETLIQKTHEARRKIRVYLSTVFGCPFEGAVKEASVLALIDRLLPLCPDEIAISDTIGVASPTQIRSLFTRLLSQKPPSFWALHLHDTYGYGVWNAATAFDCGVTQFDGSFGGVGGCPYAKGASGNLPLEDLLYFFYREGQFSSEIFTPIEKTIVKLKNPLGLTLYGHISQILLRGGTVYGI